ncbi:MAG: hypothetical protein QOE78_1335 [Alphaproteobacteria bacterium]|nr:hypothetical protein [Alphaproteobacteria bacterium]
MIAAPWLASSWRENGVSYWAVSDLGVGELETFAQLFRKAPAGCAETCKAAKLQDGSVRPAFPSHARVFA